MVWNVKYNASVSKGTPATATLRSAGETRLRIFAGMVNPPANTYRSYGQLHLMRGDLTSIFPGFHVQESYEITPSGIYIPLSVEATVLRFWVYERKYVASAYQMILIAESY